jgi:AmpD protein
MKQNNFFSADGWYSGCKHLASPNFNSRPVNTPVHIIVIHSISLPPGIYNNNYIEDFFQNQLNIDAHPYFKEIKALKVSAHFLIKRNGELIQFVSCIDRAWHAGESSYQGKENCNDFSIGIELEGDDETPFEDDQYIKLIELLGCLKKEYNIQDIVGHSDIAPSRKTDPGPLFDWKKIK